MAWVDDRIWCHPKFTGISSTAGWAWTKGCAYSAGFGTRGLLSRDQQKLVGGVGKARRELIEARLWDERENGAIYIHDWDEHNGKRDDRRAADRARKRAERAGQTSGTSAGQSAGRSAGQSSGASAGTARVDGSEGSDGMTKDQGSSVSESSTTKEARGEDTPAASDDDLFKHDEQTNYLEPDRGPDLNGLDHLFTPGILPDKAPR